MYSPGDLIDGRYRIDGVCNDNGGMGLVLHVTKSGTDPGLPLVAKICRSTDEEHIRRFRREVRLLATFAGNSRVVQIVDAGLDNDPPFFVMPYYAEGDLLQNRDRLAGTLEGQERLFLQMIECVQELHSRDTFHRDIKPQNFLVRADQIVVSDLGLTTEVGSETGFTRSSLYWGTYGYVPPEFLNGGFKHADATGDVFMLGKTMYVLLTRRDPMYLTGDEVPAPLFHVIERCCSVDKEGRYQTLAELSQSLVAAFDTLLARAGGIDEVRGILSEITDLLERERKYRSKTVLKFIEKLALLEETEGERVCREVPKGFFRVISQAPVAAGLPTMLEVYGRLVDGQDYSWAYAETIADNMSVLFASPDVPAVSKGQALELAIRAAVYMNRFAAMDTCRAMITGVSDEGLAARVAQVVVRHGDSFVSDIQPSECSSPLIRNAIKSLSRGI